MTIYELRIYTTIPGRLPNLLARFENHTLRIWEKHGIKQLGFWYVTSNYSSFAFPNPGVSKPLNCNRVPRTISDNRTPEPEQS